MSLLKYRPRNIAICWNSFVYRYSTFFIGIVKILKQKSRSAGNLFLKSSSETIRNEVKVKPVSDHVPKHLKPLTSESFGYYLAGLIDGDGHFSKQEQLVIVFNDKSISLAYYLKKEIGYGQVKKVKNKKAYLYIISSFQGLSKVLNLVNNKLRTVTKYNQVLNILKNNLKYSINFQKDNLLLLENHWLAGFSDADASFQIKIIERLNREKPEIRLNYQVDQKDKLLLDLIKTYFGGYIGYRLKLDTYYYGSTSFKSAKLVIDYFDKYHLLSDKHLNYLKWRKAYVLIYKKQHLNINGIEKIKKLKNNMNNLLKIES